MGQPPARPQDDDTSLPVDHHGLAAAPHHPRRRCAHPAHRRDVAGFEGAGITHTPITYAHATLAPGARLEIPWTPEFNALVFVLAGHGTVGVEDRPLHDGELAVLGRGDHIVVTAAEHQAQPLEVLLLGGLPIGAPIEHYGPFVMNTRDEIIQAIEDYQSGRLGIIPPDQRAPRNFA